MTIKRGEVWLADLNPIRGSEQAGIRPVLIFQNDTINTFTTTVVTIRSRRISAVQPCLRAYGLPQATVA
jgi:mRNA interferase MazF